MANFTTKDLATAFGILGNIVSFLVYLAPLPTFYHIIKKKSTEGFQSIPYAVALFSAMLYLYYAFLKTNVFLLITINSVGTVFEVTYLTIYMIYATRESKAFTLKMLVLFNMASLGLIIAITSFALEGEVRVKAVGWTCAVFSLSVFAAPLSIVRRVIRTKSVEYMPVSLSFFLTLCAVMWFFYGFLIKDYFIAAPNILGFGFGVTQMILYAVYKNHKSNILPESKVHDSVIEVGAKKERYEDQDSTDGEPTKEQEMEIIVVDPTPRVMVLVQKEDAKDTESKG